MGGGEHRGDGVGLGCAWGGMKGAVLAVDRCVCHGVTFRELKGLSERVGGGFAELSERTGCGTGCGLCRPYIEAMLRTGRTEFGVGEPETILARPSATDDPGSVS